MLYIINSWHVLIPFRRVAAYIVSGLWASSVTLYALPIFLWSDTASPSTSLQPPHSATNHLSAAAEGGWAGEGAESRLEPMTLLRTGGEWNGKGVEKRGKVEQISVQHVDVFREQCEVGIRASCLISWKCKKKSKSCIFLCNRTSIFFI